MFDLLLGERWPPGVRRVPVDSLTDESSAFLVMAFRLPDSRPRNDQFLAERMVRFFTDQFYSFVRRPLVKFTLKTFELQQYAYGPREQLQAISLRWAKGEEA